jgi:hypothetical protein
MLDLGVFLRWSGLMRMNLLLQERMAVSGCSQLLSMHESQEGQRNII